MSFLGFLSLNAYAENSQVFQLFEYSQIKNAPAKNFGNDDLIQNNLIAIESNQFIADVDVGDTIQLTLEVEKTNQIVNFEVVKMTPHANNDVSLVLKHQSSNNKESLPSHSIVTLGKNGLTGSIKFDQQHYRLFTNAQGQWLIPSEAQKRLIPVPHDHGGVPKPDHDHHHQHRPAKEQPAALKNPAQTQIDILLHYDQEFANTYGSQANIEAALNNKVTYANQVFSNSQIDVQLNLVHSELAAYPNGNSNLQALEAMRLGTSVFSNTANLRNTYGADLVGIIRQFRFPEHNSAGIAYQLGSNGVMPNYDKNYAFFVVSEGTDSGYFAPDSTFPHEIGHNFGSNHDHSHASGDTIFSYSYGHDNPGVFATIMSYDDPVVDYFSNPNLSCNGEPCGIASGALAADNARGFNEVREDIANFYASASNPVDPIDPEDPTDPIDPGDGGGSGETSTPPPETVSIQEALDNFDIDFTNTSNNDWYGQSVEYFYDNDALRAPVMENGQQSCLESIVQGPADLSYYWKIDASNEDLLSFYINDEFQESISGSSQWNNVFYSLNSNDTQLKWCFEKNSSNISGQNTAWLDRILYVSTAAPELILDRIEYDDDTTGGSLGNNNGQIDYQEKVEINLFLKNEGDAEATKIEGLLTSSHACLKVTDNREFWPSLDPSSIQDELGDFDVTNQCKESTEVTLTFQVTSREGSWFYQIPVEVGGAQIDFYSENNSISENLVLSGNRFEVSSSQIYSGNVSDSLAVYQGYYLSEDKLFDASDIYLGQDYANLGVNRSLENELKELSIPSNQPAGEYFLLIVSDHNSQHNETNEDNNVSALSITVSNIADRDQDGIPDTEDAFPDDPTESRDTDQDGVGDNADAFPEDANESRDTDNDGIGDNADLMPDDETNNPYNASFSLTLNALYKWAETNYSTLFPINTGQMGEIIGWRYIFYPSTGNYIGFNTQDNGVYVLGPSFGTEPKYIDSMLNLIQAAEIER